jgi:hypothetical protein
MGTNRMGNMEEWRRWYKPECDGVAGPDVAGMDVTAAENRRRERREGFIGWDERDEGLSGTKICFRKESGVIGAVWIGFCSMWINELYISFYIFLKRNQIRLSDLVQFDLDPLIGIQYFFFHNVFLAIIFFLIYLLAPAITFQSHATLDVINYQHTQNIKEKTMIWIIYKFFDLDWFESSLQLNFYDLITPICIAISKNIKY